MSWNGDWLGGLPLIVFTVVMHATGLGFIRGRVLGLSRKSPAAAPRPVVHTSAARPDLNVPLSRLRAHNPTDGLPPNSGRCRHRFGRDNDTPLPCPQVVPQTVRIQACRTGGLRFKRVTSSGEVTR